jgi:hypothetical protein
MILHSLQARDLSAVRKQVVRLQVAIAELQRLDGAKGFFRGAGALMSREVPFYVFGMVLYEQYKRCINGAYFGNTVREMANHEYIAIGALAGATASFLTTPADVVKSRLMTAAAGSTVSTGQVLVELIQKEGVRALFKGALPRAVWIAPLGAMNFAGYELAKRAMGVGQGAAADEKIVAEAAPDEEQDVGDAPSGVATTGPEAPSPAPVAVGAPVASASIHSVVGRWERWERWERDRSREMGARACAAHASGVYPTDRALHANAVAIARVRARAPPVRSQHLLHAKERVQGSMCTACAGQSDSVGLLAAHRHLSSLLPWPGRA